MPSLKVSPLDCVLCRWSDGAGGAPQGYFRQGQVEMATSFFSDACISFTQALALQPQDPSLLAAIQSAGTSARAQRAGM